MPKSGKTRKNKVRDGPSEKLLKETTMQEEVQTEDEISLSDIFRALWAKVWILVAALILGIAIGGGFGFLRYYNVHYYGADVTYFVWGIKTETTTSGDGETQTTTTQFISDTTIQRIINILPSNDFQRELMKNLPEAADIEQGSEEEREFFRLLDESVSYSFLENTSQITAAVSVLNDEQLAAHLLDSINSTLPTYITDWLQTDPSIEVEFRLLYDINCRLLNPHQWVTEGIKYGALLGLAALVIACVAVVVVDRTDTRLRDYHKVAQKFNLPVLGVIPRISESHEAAAQKDGTEVRK